MKEMNNNKRKQRIDAVKIVFLVCIIALVIYALTYKRETHIYETSDNSNTSALVCTSNSNDSEVMFFNSDNVSNAEHKVKLVYINDTINKISYEFTGEYDSEWVAKEAKGSFNTKYNIYMGNHNLELNTLSPVFQYVGNKAKVELYLDDYKNMNPTIGELFFISSTSLDSIAKESKEETKNYYEKKGFSCIIKD